MRDSALISFFMFILKKISDIYNNSFLEKIMKSVCGFFTKRANNSSICNLFKNSFLDGSIYRNSVLFKIITFPIRFIKKLSEKFSDKLKVMQDNSEFLNTLDNLLYVPIKDYGFLILAFTIGMFVTLFINAQTTTTTIILGCILLVMSIVMTIIPCSIHAVFSKSVILNPVIKLFNKYSIGDGSDSLQIKKHPIKNLKLFMAIFFALGIFSGFVSPVLVMASVVFAIAILLILHNTLVGVFAVVFCAPIMPTMVCVGLLGITFVAFLKELICNKNKKYILTSIDFFVISFMLLEVFSAITSFNVTKSIMTLVINIAFTIVYFIIVNTIRTKNQWYNLVLTFVFAGVFVSLFGIYQNFFIGTTTTSWIDEDMFSEIGTRVYATLDNPNVLGQYLVMVIPVAFALMWSSKKLSNKIILFLSVVIMGMCVIYTWSRAAWVGVVLAIGFFMLMKDRRWLTICIVALVILPFILPQSILQRITSIGDMNDSSTAYRVSVWIASLRMAFDYILCGIGLGTGAFERVYQNYALNGAGFALHAHNFYIQLVVEMGIFALILFLIIMFSVYKEIVLIKDKKSVNKDVALAIGGAFIGYMFEGMAENLWYNYRMILIFWIYLALFKTGANVTKTEQITLDSVKE